MYIIYIGDASCTVNVKSAFEKTDSTVSVDVICDKIPAADFIKDKKPDMVFVDAACCQGDVLSVAKNLSAVCPAVVVVSDTDASASEASIAGVFAYVLKPLDVPKLEQIMSRIHRLKGAADSVADKVYIKTFGRFDVFVNGKPLHFSNKKSKELLALLVDQNGGSVTMDHIIGTLWEDRKYDDCTKAIYRIALKNLRDTLAQAGIGDILIESRGQRSVDTGKIRCDYYDFLADPERFSSTFNDEYMFDYAWGEVTLAQIAKKCK